MTDAGSDGVGAGEFAAEMARAKESMVHLSVSFHRLTPTDSTGSFDVTCTGPEEWIYANVGPHHGAQCMSEGEEARVLEFGGALCDLVREYFKGIRPILDKGLR